MTETSSGVIEEIKQAAELIKKFHHAVALTGAGISTPSGIPDFRSPGKGLWTHSNPMEVASLTAFRHNPEQFYAWFHPLALQIYTARPNPAHMALAGLEAAGFISAIITQNIDGLHSRAGSKNVVEVHGTLNTLTCTNCYRQVPAGTVLDEYINQCTVPHCTVCGSVLKPDVILYEEQLPVNTWLRAEQATKDCGLMLVVGTSLEVLPSARLPVEAMDHGAQLIILNNATTFMDVRADVVIQADVAETLPLIAEQVLKSK
jgi:NAD-dependent deacetylase